jgi:branched-chain amino acid transport system substrate-binding protein
MRRHMILLAALLLLASACGQKANVAGSVVTAGAEGGTGGFVDGGTVVDGGTTPSGPAAPGAKTPAGGGAGGAGGGGGPAAGGGGPAAGGGAGPATGGGGPAAPAGAADRTGITSTTIKIGIHAPESGAAAVSTFRQAVGVYSQYAGAIKGLGNRRIIVEARDDHFDPATARTVCKELVEKEKVFLLIGGAGVDQIKSCAEYAATAGVPYFSPGVTEGPFRGLSNYFALSETYNQQNVQIAQLIKNQVKKTKIGMVLTDSPLLQETEAHFKAQAKANGLSVVYSGKLAKDAGKTQTDTQVSNLKGKGAEVVYALISPTVFGFLVSSAKQQAFNPTYTGPGLSVGVNLVAKAVCPPPPFPDVRVLSPMVQEDVINQRDPAYEPAYRKKNGGSSQPDDIGILLWGIEKAVRLMMEADGADLSRQGLVKALTSGKSFATNVYAPVKYGGVPHFGATQTTLLKLDCNSLEYKTASPFASKF